MIKSPKISTEEIWEYLKQIPDPEIPVLNIVDLGVVREVQLNGEELIISITPTYIGCPAMKVIEEDIVSVLKSRGFTKVHIKTILSPAWTTDWIGAEAQQKLKEYGIAPPEKGITKIACPHCNSINTEMKSQFGSTACKALYICKDCLEPFDYFKCI